MPCDEVLKGKVYEHDEGGLRYCVLDMLLDMTKYEMTHEIGKRTVYYIQLDEGIMPAGTPYARDEEDFKDNFSPI